MPGPDEGLLATLNALREAFESALGSALREIAPDLTEEELGRLLHVANGSPEPVTLADISRRGRPIIAADVRPKKGGTRGRDPGPWVEVALELDAGDGREWTLPRDIASKAANNVTNKRRRDGKLPTGRWKHPIWANVRPNPSGPDYILTIVNDPDRGVDPME